MEAYLKLENVQLTLKDYKSRDLSIRRMLVQTLSGKHNQEYQVPSYEILKDISMELTNGTRLGLIGGNGAGKSTLLRVMAGIYEPTAGRIESRGRVATLLNTGLSLEPKLTGYQNIRLGCALLGVPGDMLDEKIQEIIEFSELGDSVHKVLEYYSDGMRARLGFSIATSVKADILLIDEAIGTGDKFFLKKATQRIHDLTKSAGVVVLASHNETVMRQLCNKIALIQNGQLVHLGDVDETFKKYSAAA